VQLFSSFALVVDPKWGLGQCPQKTFLFGVGFLPVVVLKIRLIVPE
jgi:hypothetical protein